LKRFLHLLVIPDGSDPIGLLCSIHRNGVMAKVAETPLMDHRYTWARSMIASIDHWTKFCIMTCNRHRFMEAKALLQGFIDETLIGLTKQGMQYRKTADQGKRLRDSDTHTQTHTHKHTQTHTSTHKQTQTDTNTHKHTQTDTHRHKQTQTHTHTHTHTHTNTHKHTQTHTQTHKQPYAHRPNKSTLVVIFPFWPREPPEPLALTC
jgi:hypothetical protein